MRGGGATSQNVLNLKQNPKFKSYALCFLSTICIHWGIASYQPFIDTALILLCAGLIVILIDNKGEIKTTLFKSRFLIIATALGAITYKILLDIFKAIGYTGTTYNNQLVNFADLPDRILLAINLSFSHLISYDVPFMPMWISVLFVLVLVLGAILLFVSSLHFKAKIAIALLFLIALVSSQAHNVLSKTLSIYPETEYYGFMFVRVLIVALALKFCIDLSAKKFAQNVLFVLSWLIIWVCVVQNLYAQRTQKLAFDSEIRLLNRIVDRLEQDERFSYDKKYCGIMFGEYENIRNALYDRQTKDNTGGALKSHVLITPWGPGDAFRNAMYKYAFSNCGIISSHYGLVDKNQHFFSQIKRLDNAGILDILEPWPHKNSVVVFEDIIVFVASKGNLDEIRTLAKTLPDSQDKDK